MPVPSTIGPKPLAVLVMIITLASAGLTSGLRAAETEDESFETRVAERTRHAGFFDVYTGQDGRVLASIPPAGSDGIALRMIHALRLTRGLGSNPIGLDRGWGNNGRILRFRRIGNRLVVEAENWRYRAETDNALEREAVAASFARSFLWSTEILATHDDGRILIDLGEFLIQDALSLAERLGAGGGTFKRADDRSMPDADSILAFPDNVEIDAWMTFTGDEPGAQVRATAADPAAVTLIQHHSFVRLPDDGYRPRAADPRSGSFEVGYRDFAAPLDEAIVRSRAVRHRLSYKQPGQPDSGVAEPVVFHIDPGAPDRIREALLEGASWWGEAFEAAGFPGGYEVRLLPADAHPLDIRYNVVQWVHRQTRGWSYGGGIIDPRTGEIVKGHVILGSQRVRQDRMIFEGLAGVAATGTGQADDPVELSLDRIRQLAAHEVGHALGFGHNFAASSNDRASVMDYPAPWVDVVDGELDFSRAYDHGIGEWDRVTARWLYAEFPTGTDEQAALDAILDDAFEAGLLYVADEHGRDVGTAHPEASVWDNGDDAVAELERALEVRSLALARFGADRLRAGRPMNELREVLVPIYLYHRYQVDAAAKAVGGLRFQYGVRGGSVPPITPVGAAEQRRALDALLATLTPERLDLPESLLALMPPGTRGFGFSEAPPETLASRAEPAFDPFAAAETAADITLAALLDPTRSERLVRQHALDRTLPSLGEVVEAIGNRVGEALRRPANDRHALIAQRTAARFAAALMALDASGHSAEVRAEARAGLESLVERLPRRNQGPFKAWMTRQVRGHLDRPAPPIDPAPSGPEIPPGSPIGAMDAGRDGIGLQAEACWHCD